MVHKPTNLCHPVSMETTTRTQDPALAGAHVIIELLLAPDTRDNPGVQRTARDWLRAHEATQ